MKGLAKEGHTHTNRAGMWLFVTYFSVT